MSLELLDKTRKIYRLLNRQESDKVDFNDFCRMLSQEMEVNVLLLSRKGKMLGMRLRKDIPVIPQMQDISYGEYLEKDTHERLLNILSTKENVNLSGDGCSSQYGRKETGDAFCVPQVGSLFYRRYYINGVWHDGDRTCHAESRE